MKVETKNCTTDKKFWDDRWTELDGKFLELGEHAVSDAIFAFFDKYLANREGKKLLEIGGAPGRYLGALAQNYNMKAASVDYSSVGCEQLRRNFSAAGFPIEIIERDVMAVMCQEQDKADVVFSLGLVEHFENPIPILKAHLDYLTDDGILIVGVPNYSGIYEIFWKKLSPELLSTHVLKSMNKENWVPWVEELALNQLELTYLGGFHPQALDKGETNKISFEKISAKLITKSFGKFPKIISEWNHPYTSAYLMGAFKKI